MKNSFFVVALFCAATVSAAPSIERAQRFADAGCFLSAARELNSLMDKTPNVAAQVRLNELDRTAAKHLSEEDLSASEIFYWKGFSAWRSGHVESARNEWTKYAALAARLDSEPRARRLEVDDHLAIARTYLQEQQRVQEAARVQEEIATAPVAEIKPKPRRSRRRKRADDSARAVPKEDTRAREAHLLDKAATAEKSGQLEYADRLYQLVLRINPESAPARTRREELQQRMR